MFLLIVSRDFWRSPDGRFDVIKKPMSALVGGKRMEATFFVVYDADLGRRKVFETFKAAEDYCRAAVDRQPAA